MEGAPSATASEYAASEFAVSEGGDRTPGMYPPYPPYATGHAPPSVVDAIMAGREIRNQHKNAPKKSARPPPRPAIPRGPKVTDVKLSKRAARAHARCLRRHGAVLTERLERMSKPQRRNIICLWRERANTLPAEVIAHFRSMLNADEPFKPDQAYEYFINLRKTKKKIASMKAAKKLKSLQKDVMELCDDKRFIWARNATVALARGIQHRLSRPGELQLCGRLQRLSNIILDELTSNMKISSCRFNPRKAKFMKEMSDKIAVWIDEILTDSDDRMLMMDFDEDDEVIRADEGPISSASSLSSGGGLSSSAAASTPAGSPAGSPPASPAHTPATSAAPTPTETPAPTPAVTPAAASPQTTPKPSKTDISKP